MISRRQFLRGDMSGRKPAVRPPWALDEAAFLLACTRCGECARVCPTKVIVIERGYPVVDFSRGECTFCTACPAACGAGALLRNEDRPAWAISAQIASTCMAHADTVCRSCGDACMEAAIRFRPRLGGAALPEVDGEKCTGCGACVAPCPVKAITLA
jgi:ferredoxin-type protein NapF